VIFDAILTYLKKYKNNLGYQNKTIFY